MLEELTPDAIAALLAELPNMPLDEKESLLNELESLEKKRTLKTCREDFLAFCAYIYQDWKEGPHHRYLKPILHDVDVGKETRVTISMPPRFGKSETVAYLFIAWHLGRHPNHHIMMATHTAALSADFGRKIRNLLDTPKYREIFPETVVSKDKSAADNWTTTAGGKYLAIGIGANVAGHGAHMLVADDLCVHKDAIVHTLHGDVPAHSVLVGDCLLGEAGWQQVVRKTASEHAMSVCVNGLRMSNEHPVWTFNAGWQRASALCLGDLLRTTTFWCKIKSSVLRGLSHVTAPRSASAPAEGSQAVCGRRDGVAEAELGAAPRTAEDFGWYVGAAVRLFGFSDRLRRSTELAKNNATQGRAGDKHYAAGQRWLQEKTARGVEVFAAGLGLLLGVRRVSRVEQLDTPEAFVNFEVEGDNTFFAQGILTHNCSEQAILANPDHAFSTAWEYMQVGPLQRLMPGGRIVMIGTRWGKKDPIGRALAWAENNPGSTPWNEVRFPAILPSGKSLWPEQWPVEQLLAKKAGMQPQFWAAQYMQEPTSEEGALLKREWWKFWTKDAPPDVEFIIQVWDTAHETKNYSDYSACITWGVWFNEEANRHELIMLNAIKGRWEFPQLKQKALDQYQDWQPECLLIEKKASGAPLIQELRQMDMIVEEYSPSRGAQGVANDKRARVNSVAPLFFDGVVWAPEHRWAMEVINECAEFPNGEHDDFVDCVSLALSRYRRGGFVSLSSDRQDEPRYFRRQSYSYY